MLQPSSCYESFLPIDTSSTTLDTKRLDVNFDANDIAISKRQRAELVKLDGCGQRVDKIQNVYSGGFNMRQRLAQNLSNYLGKSGKTFTSALLLRRGRTASTAAAKPALSPPQGYSGHDYAIFLLHVAAEIEHALMVQYLYAAYSLGGPQVPKAHRAKVSGWQTILLGVAKEEMGHLITVQNVLRLIGAPLNLDREDFPWDAPYTPFKFTLEPLTPKSLARYVFVESPETWPVDAEPYREKITALASRGQERAPNQVGKLYALMIDVLSDHDLVPDHLFQAETLTYQAAADEWGRGYSTNVAGSTPADPAKPDLIIKTAYSRSTATDALKAVASQGEAPDIDDELNEQSHFRRFFNIFKDFPEAGSSWSPIRPLAVNPTTVKSDPPVDGSTYIVDPVSRDWAELLNLRYRMLLIYLSHSFRLSGGTGTERDGRARGLVLNNTVGEMYNVRAIAKSIVQLPCGGPDAGLRAGPAFEMPYSLELPQAERDAWQLHLDLLNAATPIVEGLKRNAREDALRYLSDLALVDRRKAAAIEAILGRGGARSETIATIRSVS